MINRLLSLLLPLLLAVTSFAQDRIITRSLDTLHCKIIRKTPGAVYFKQLQGGVPTTSRIARREILSIGNDGFVVDKVDERIPFGNFDLSFSGGPSWLVASTKDAKNQAMQLGVTRDKIDSYYRQLKLGWAASAGGHWFISPGMGVGATWRFFFSGAEIWSTFDPHDGQTLFYGQMKEKLLIQYAGPSLKASTPLGRSQRSVLNSVVSAGMVFYRDEALSMHNYLLITGNNFGSAVETSLETFLTPKIALGAHLSLFAAKLKKIKVDSGSNSYTIDLPKDQRENVSALDLRAGIRIIL